MAKKSSSIIKKKDTFESSLYHICVSNQISPTPLIKILSNQPKFGEKWKTYSFHEDPELEYFEVYVQYENYLKDGIIKKVILRNQTITNKILICLQENMNNFKTITTLKFYGCQLTTKEIPTLFNILYDFKNIIDLSFDKNPLKEPIFYFLIKENNLKYLSIQHCKIDETSMKGIAEELKINNKLIFLDLSCNHLGDIGCKLLSDAVRQNRSLCSLILVDNLITDEGIDYLMKALISFEMNIDEIAIRRKIRFKQELEKLGNQNLKRQESGNLKRKSKDKSGSNAMLRKLSQKSRKSSAASIASIVSNEYHPFVDDSYVENGEVFCKGNNKIAYINIAYNKITEDGFNLIEYTIRYQINNFLSTEGLADIILTGNRVELPDFYTEIQKLLDYKKTAEKTSTP